MVLVAYVAGLITTPGVVLAVFGGMAWWRRYRGSTADQPVTLTLLPPPTPVPPQDSPRVSRVSMRAAPGRRRSVRGRPR